MTVRGTDSKRRLPIRIKMGWGAGGLADNFIMNAFLQLVNPIYNLALGLRPDLIGYATGIPRFFDALFDVWMGNVSDNTRSRWGRRRPYIFAGAVLSAVLLPLLWMPPSRSGSGLFVYLLLMGSVYLLAYSVFVVPYNALGYELTQDYDERTRVQSWRAIIGLLGSLTIPWIYKLTRMAGHGSGGGDAAGAVWVSVGLGAVILVTGLLPVFCCRENPAIQAQNRISIRQALSYTFRNRSFLVLSAAYIVIIVGHCTAGAMGFYLGLFTIAAGDKDVAGSVQGWAGTFMTAGAYIGVPLAVWLATRKGKREAMWFGLSLGLLSTVAQWFTLSGRWAGIAPWMQPHVLAAFVFGLGIQGCWVMMDAMTVDVCDEDELRSGLRREGMYGAVRSLAMKGALALTNVIGGFALVWTGYVTNQAPPPGVVHNMKLAYVAIQGIGLTAGLLLFRLYPITRARAEETRRLLDERHRVSACAPPAG